MVDLKEIINWDFSQTSHFQKILAYSIGSIYKNDFDNQVNNSLIKCKNSNNLIRRDIFLFIGMIISFYIVG